MTPCAPSTSPFRSTISPPRAPSTAARWAVAEGRSSDQLDRLRPVRASDRRASRSRGASRSRSTNPVDGHDVPVPHFGVVLTMPDWEALAARVDGGGHRVRDRAAYPLQGAGRASRRRCSFAIPAATRSSSRRLPTTPCCSRRSDSMSRADHRRYPAQARPRGAHARGSTAASASSPSIVPGGERHRATLGRRHAALHGRRDGAARSARRSTCSTTRSTRCSTCRRCWRMFAGKIRDKLREGRARSCWSKLSAAAICGAPPRSPARSRCRRRPRPAARRPRR